MPIFGHLVRVIHGIHGFTTAIQMGSFRSCIVEMPTMTSASGNR